MSANELKNIANAERFNRERFRDDTEFADWVISRCRHALSRSASGPSEEAVSWAQCIANDKVLYGEPAHCVARELLRIEAATRGKS